MFQENSFILDLVFLIHSQRQKKERYLESKIDYLEDKCGWRNRPVSAKKLPGNIIKAGLAHSPGVLTVNIHDIFHNKPLSIMMHWNNGATFN